MQDIQKELNLTYLFISHDLGIIRHICDKIGIMYKGRFVEEGTPEDIFNNPKHIYTKRLVSAIPDIDPSNRENQKKFRAQVNQEYKEQFNDYFNVDGLAYELKPISDTHSVALPKGE